MRRLLAALRDDLRYGARVMRKTPGFTAVAVLMLALGTGANAALFSVVDAVMLRSPFARPEEITWVGAREAGGRTTMAIPRAAYDRLTQLPLFTAVAIHSIGSPVATGIAEPRRTQAECHPASMIEVLGARPLLGRWFTTDEDRPGGPPVAVISHRFWQRDLRGDPDVLGRTIALDGTPVTIIGVMPRGFGGARSLPNRDLWLPLGQSTTARPLYGCRPPGTFVNAVVRLRSDLAPAEGTRLLNADAELAGASPDSSTPLVLQPLSDQILGHLRGPFLALTGAVLAVLLIASVNVANLGLQRLVGRRRELAVRLALGASRRRIVGQTITEHLLVAALGAAAGVLLAYATLGFLVDLLPSGMPHAEEIRLNERVLAASIGVALLAGFGVGLVPAMRASSGSLRAALGDGDRGSTRNSRAVRRLLVVTELALGVALLVGALLMVQTFLTLRPSAPGFDPRHKTIVMARLPGDVSPEATQRFFSDMSREISQLPGVRAVAGTTYVPMSRSVDVFDVEVGGTSGRVFTGVVSANYFDVLSIPVTHGRGFEDLDRSGAPTVAVVNEAFVRRWLPDRDPLGASIRLELGDRTVTLQVVGVIGDMRSWGADTVPRPELYLPLVQAVPGSPSFIVHADPRTATALPAALRAIASRLRPGQLVDRVESFEEMLAGEVAQPRFGAWLFGLLAALAVTLAAVGLAATLAWSVTERRREIGLRMALGARQGHIRWLVLGQTLVLSSAGIAGGLALAALSTRLLGGWLYDVTPLDPATFAGCAVLMLMVSLAAAYVPTRRATRVEPLVALRSE